MTKKTPMKIVKFDDEESWMKARDGKITGSTLGKVFSKRNGSPIQGFYELVAANIAIPASNENVMDRGHRLEEEAIYKFSEETGKEVNTDLVLWIRGDNEDIALSPDGYINKEEAVEVKCLASAKHIEAYLKQKIPGEYDMQVLQYFIVNDDLKTLYFVFYDPRMPKIEMFYLEFKREDMAEKIATYLKMEHEALNEVERISKELTF